jgi:hypothetical protein
MCLLQVMSLLQLISSSGSGRLLADKLLLVLQQQLVGRGLRSEGNAMRLRRLLACCEGAAAHAGRSSSDGRGVCLRAGAALLAVSVSLPLPVLARDTRLS